MNATQRLCTVTRTGVAGLLRNVDGPTVIPGGRS